MDTPSGSGLPGQHAEETLEQRDHEASGPCWLNEKTWGQVTREERYFCAELFSVIRQDFRRFVKFLNLPDHKVGKTNRTMHWPILETETNWDPAYEICFYRDIGFYRNSGKNGTIPAGEFSQKRTFDLALFSNEAIILIEAKVHQGFDGKQLGHLNSDRRNVSKWTKVPEEKIFLVGLISSEYHPRCKTQKHFDLIITWSGLACWYGDDHRAKQIFSRANSVRNQG